MPYVIIAFVLLLIIYLIFLRKLKKQFEDKYDSLVDYIELKRIQKKLERTQLFEEITNLLISELEICINEAQFNYKSGFELYAVVIPYSCSSVELRHYIAFNSEDFISKVRGKEFDTKFEFGFWKRRVKRLTVQESDALIYAIEDMLKRYFAPEKISFNALNHKQLVHFQLSTDNDILLININKSYYKTEENSIPIEEKFKSIFDE